MSGPKDVDPSRPKEATDRDVLARSLPVFVVFAGLAAAGIWGYLRLGAGSAGFGGLLVLFAPVTLAAGALLAPALRRLSRARWASLLLGLAFPYLLVSCALPEWMGRTSFDSAIWKAAAGARSQERIRQVDDLLDSAVLDHKSRTAILDLLGPDDSAQGTGWGSGYFSAWDSVYWLGDDRGFGIDSEWLVLRFNPEGMVTEYQIVQD